LFAYIHEALSEKKRLKGPLLYIAKKFGLGEAWHVNPGLVRVNYKFTQCYNNNSALFAHSGAFTRLPIQALQLVPYFGDQGTLALTFLPLRHLHWFRCCGFDCFLWKHRSCWFVQGFTFLKGDMGGLDWSGVVGEGGVTVS